ncbi:alpha/beta fold hydrolase [Nocardia sp. NPDC057668]|uniref:alpha/beta fold hydrolase n=1 Tax=Nocardia sp. NPDC057668 TaxID=3346202 RepID=UPI00366D7A84
MTQSSTTPLWYRDYGAGDPLLLLHPAAVDSRAFTPNVPALSEHFHVFTPDRRGHGHTPDVDGPLTFDLMANDTVDFLEQVIAAPTALLGYSDGATVALLTALRRPDLITHLILVAGVYHRSGWAPGILDQDLTPPDFMRDSYAEVSPHGRAHYDTILRKIAAEHTTQPALTPADLATLPTRTLILLGDDDEVLPTHAQSLYESLPNAELAVVPGTSHGLLSEKPSLCHAILLDFLTNAPVETFAPIRRRPAAPN